LLILSPSHAKAQDIVLADFEQSTYQWLPTGGPWTTTGTAFGTNPLRPDLHDLAGLRMRTGG
jgi:hypothetical protein